MFQEEKPNYSLIAGCVAVDGHLVTDGTGQCFSSIQQFEEYCYRSENRW